MAAHKNCESDAEEEVDEKRSEEDRKKEQDRTSKEEEKENDRKCCKRGMIFTAKIVDNILNSWNFDYTSFNDDNIKHAMFLDKLICGLTMAFNSLEAYGDMKADKYEVELESHYKDNAKVSMERMKCMLQEMVAHFIRESKKKSNMPHECSTCTCSEGAESFAVVE